MGNVFEYPLGQATPLSLQYTENGVAKDGLDVYAQIRSITDGDLYLDFADNTWKSSGWVQKLIQLTSIGTGMYQYIWDSSIAVIASKIVVVEYSVTTVGFEANDSDVITYTTPELNPDTVATKVWDKQIAAHVTDGSFGKLVQDTHNFAQIIHQIETGRWKIENYQLILYQEDNITEIAKFNIFDKDGNPSDSIVFDRVRV